MGQRVEPTRVNRQALLRAVQRLNLALLVDRQDHRIVGRIEIEPHNIDDFLGELGIVRQLEGARQMRLEAMRLPDPLHRRRRDAGRLGHGSHTPLRGARRFGVERHGHDILHRLGRQRLPARRPRGILQQAFNTLVAIAPAPPPNGQHALADRRGNRYRAHAFARHKHDPRPPYDFLRRVAVANQIFKSLPVNGGNLNAFDLAHPARLAHFNRVENPMSETEHWL